MSLPAAYTWWLTGLSGAGKTTLAQALSTALRGRQQPACIIDGDELRAGLCQDLGFDAASRAENVRRAAHMARLLNDSGVHTGVALISPAADARALVFTPPSGTAGVWKSMSAPPWQCASIATPRACTLARGLPNWRR